MTSKTQRLWFPLQPNNNFDPHYPVLKPYWRISSAADFWMGVEAGILELGYYIVMIWPLQFIKLLTFLDLEQDFKRACRISICLRSQWNVRFFHFIILKYIRHIITHVKLFWKVLGLLFIDTFLGFWQAFQFWKWTSLKSQLTSSASSIHY